MKILSVDDSAIVRDMFSSLCLNLGYADLHQASSGEEALDILRRDDIHFDCLCLDISMTGISGIELCAALRTIPRYAFTPVIMVTSMREREFIDGAFKAGATDYITKPFVASDLAECLGNAQAQIDERKRQLSLTGDADTNSLTQEIHLPGFRDVVRYNALGKYLHRMSSVGLSCSQIISIRIDRFDALCAKASLDELQYLLCEVADAICEALKTQVSVLSYKGEGIFVAIMGMGHVTEAVELEGAVQDLLDSKNSSLDDGTELDLEISIGDPIQPLLQSDDAAGIIFSRAIARSNARYVQKSSTPSQISIRGLVP